MNIQKYIDIIKTDPKSLIQLQQENKLVKLIVKGAILGKDIGALSESIIAEAGNNPDIANIQRLIVTILKAIDINSSTTISEDDKMHAEQIVMNLLNKDPSLENSEIARDVKVALAVNSFDNEINSIIKYLRSQKNADFEILGIDSRFKPHRKDGYIKEFDEKRSVFIVSAPSHTSTRGYVVGGSPDKLWFIGVKDGLVKQEYTRNEYYVKPIYIVLPGGKIIQKADNKILCKSVPVEEISESLAKEIIKKLSNTTTDIIIGGALAGNEARFLNGEIQLETFPFKKFIDHIQSRILIAGRTGDGKTVWATQLQRQIMDNTEFLQSGIVTISRDVDNLTNGGETFKAFDPSWDEKGLLCKKIKENINLEKRTDYKKITISGDTLLPDINKLSKETLFSMINNSSCSDQVKIALKRYIEESDDVVSVFQRAKEGQLLGEEYTSSQDDALRRLMNSLIPVNYTTVQKIDIKEALENNKYIGFFIKGLNSDIYGTMIVHELYNLHKSKNIRNPIKEGRLLIIDEVQKYMRFDAFRDIFEMVVLDGRGLGIMFIGIIQSADQAKRLCSYKDFVLYQAETLDNGQRVINIDDKIAIIPPLAPEVI
jgi:hypothetical protein